MADTPLTHEVLKARHRDQRDEWPQSLSLRVHRALSWLDRAEQCSDDDGRFIFLWIAFNAAYAQEFNDIERNREAKRLAAFLEKIVSLDTHKALYHLIWEQFPNTIRVLLDNQFVFPAFWEHQRGLITEEAWKDAFANANKAARARDWRWGYRQGAGRDPSSGSTRSEINWYTAARHGTARSIGIRCVTAQRSYRAWCPWLSA
jgi:hypothetical protein